ncbi:MAG: hydrogenase iron-sulfur subunit [Lysobacterales bacterium]
MNAAIDPPRAGRAWRGLERCLDRVLVEAGNPLTQLGAVAGLLLLVLLASGVYLFVVFDTSVDGAWRSIDRLSRAQPFPGGWLRSLHRYAADGLMLVVFVHLLREWLLDRGRGFRRLTWLTGVPLLVLLYVSAIGGFWLTWDRLGQYSALASAELLDRLPFLAGSLTRNFVNAAAVSDRLFSLLIFVHLGVPLLLLFGLWFHLQRIHRPQVLPARPLALGVLATLAVLAALRPVTSQAPADLALAPTALPFDWLLLHLHPLADASSPALVLVLIGASLVFLLLWPTRPAAQSPPVAVVDPAHCNGCRRCVDDCPTAAITLVPHPNAKPGRQLAVVAAARCAACGICAGACPAATPFRRGQALATGIDLPGLPLSALRQRLQLALAAPPGARPIVVFRCRHGAAGSVGADPDVHFIDLLCAGQLPPAFVDYALRGGAAAVLVSACSDSGCEYRLGSLRSAERMAGRREPRLRKSVSAERFRLVFANRGDEAQVAAALATLRAGIETGGRR